MLAFNNFSSQAEEDKSTQWPNINETIYPNAMPPTDYGNTALPATATHLRQMEGRSMGPGKRRWSQPLLPCLVLSSLSARGRAGCERTYQHAAQSAAQGSVHRRVTHTHRPAFIHHSSTHTYIYRCVSIYIYICMYICI